MIAVGWPSWRSANYIIVQSYSQRNDSVRHKLTRTVLQVNLELKAFVSTALVFVPGLDKWLNNAELVLDHAQRARRPGENFRRRACTIL